MRSPLLHSTPRSQGRGQCRPLGGPQAKRPLQGASRISSKRALRRGGGLRRVRRARRCGRHDVCMNVRQRVHSDAAWEGSVEVDAHVLTGGDFLPVLRDHGIPYAEIPPWILALNSGERVVMKSHLSNFGVPQPPLPSQPPPPRRSWKNAGRLLPATAALQVAV